jgi:SOS-response transcriptional repressor LexA
VSSNEGSNNPASTRDRIFDFLVRYKRAHDGNSPSLREIADACHIVLSGVHYHLTHLEKEGRIRIEGQRSRTIEIVGAAWQPPDDGPGSDEDEPDHADTPTGRPAVGRGP